MRRSFCLVVGSLTLFPLFACGDSEGTGGSGAGTGTTGTTTSSTGGGGPTGSGDCDSAADCSPDGACVQIVPGGFRVCQYPVVEATMCHDFGTGGGGTGGGGTGGAGGGATGPSDECCTSDDCNRICVLGPQYKECGPPSGIEVNICTDDQCDTAQDCGGDICVQPGIIGNKARQCLTTKCAADSDCTAEAGGGCKLVFDSCCEGAARGLFCVYPTGGCRKDADCDPGSFCDVSGNDAKCVVGAPNCPVF